MGLLRIEDAVTIQNNVRSDVSSAGLTSDIWITTLSICSDAQWQSSLRLQRESADKDLPSVPSNEPVAGFPPAINLGAGDVGVERSPVIGEFTSRIPIPTEMTGIPQNGEELGRRSPRVEGNPTQGNLVYTKTAHTDQGRVDHQIVITPPYDLHQVLSVLGCYM